MRNKSNPLPNSVKQKRIFISKFFSVALDKTFETDRKVAAGNENPSLSQTCGHTRDVRNELLISIWRPQISS